MKNWLFASTLLFSILIVATVIGADTGRLPSSLDYIYHFPGGDKVGHFILYGILSFLLNKSTLLLFPKKNVLRIILTTSLLLSIVIGLEEWSQSLFPSRTMSIIDLAASYAGVATFAFLAHKTSQKMQL